VCVDNASRPAIATIQECIGRSYASGRRCFFIPHDCGEHVDGGPCVLTRIFLKVGQRLGTSAGISASYGSLGAVIILLLWLYISFYIILLGAEINAELELQTAVDTTTGRPKPMGKRGAFVADHVAGGPQGDRRPSSPVTRDPTAAKPGGS
jgi:hypothetical protein